MNLIDTHTHIYTEEFDADRDLVVQRALDAGIVSMWLPNIDSTSIETMHQLVDQYPDIMVPMMGLHPTEVPKSYAKELLIIERQLARYDYRMIGEVGLDLYWDKSLLKQQKEVFEEQLRWCLDLDLPVSIHCRDAFDEVFDSIYKIGSDQLKGVFHCFSGEEQELREVLKLPGFYIGVNGVITFKKVNLIDLLPLVPDSRIVFETDAPYLSPVPYRGKRNEPAYLKHTFEFVSEKLGKDPSSFALKCCNNSLSLLSSHIPEE